MKPILSITFLLSTASCITVIASTPEAPSYQTLIKYSGSTGELIWNRVADARGIRSFEPIPSLPATARIMGGVIESRSQSQDSCSSSSSNGGTSSCSSSSSSQSPELAGLSAEVYSRTALELFWNRQENGANSREFQISRNGEYVGRTDGNSFFDRDLSPGTDYLYEITIIQNGNNISSHNIDVRTRGTSSNNSSSNSNSDGDHSSTVYGETYSRSALEIFWETTSAEPTMYRVYRNGEFLGSFDARSHFDDNLAADTEYRYEVYSEGDNARLLGEISLRTSK